MNKEFVPYELALRLKKLGFDEPCCEWYENSFFIKNDGSIGNSRISIETNYHKNSDDEGDCEAVNHCSRPTFSQAFRWFRENYEYWSYIKEATKGACRFYIEKFDEKFFNSDIINSYEEAELACLDKLLDIVEQTEK